MFGIPELASELKSRGFVVSKELKASVEVLALVDSEFYKVRISLASVKRSISFTSMLDYDAQSFTVSREGKRYFGGTCNRDVKVTLDYILGAGSRFNPKIKPFV